MKPAPLLLILPFLFSGPVMAARPLDVPELRADGRYQFSDQGRPKKFRIARDELQKTGPKGSRKVIISAKDHLRKVQDDARQLSSFDERVDLVAYEEGKPETDANRRLVTNKVSVTLDEGIDPTALGLSVNARTMRDLVYAPREFIMEFGDAAEALNVAEALRTVAGVMRCTVLLADKKENELIPTDQYFGTSTLRYANDIVDDLADYKVNLSPIPLIARAPNTRAFQWYLNKEASVTNGMVPLPRLTPYRDAQLPPFVAPNEFKLYPKYFETPVDINVKLAWDELSPANSLIDGSGVKVGVMDDGVQVNPIHPDLTSSRIDIQNDYNFIDGNPALSSDPRSDNPTPPVNSGNNHGTAVAGLILATRNTNNRGITGVAPESTLLAYRMIGGYVSPDRFADGMVWGATAIEPQKTADNPFGLRNGNEWRRGVPKFDVSNNSWGPKTFGADLHPMDPYLRKALTYGVTEGRVVAGVARGIIYVFSAGNDGEDHGDTNMVASKNSIYTLAVGGISDIGRRISYSNTGACINVVAPTGGNELAPRIQLPSGALFPDFPPVVPTNEKARAMGWTLTPDYWDMTTAVQRDSQQIISLDVPRTTGGVAGYNPNFNGTSAAAPIAAGVVALVLEANPNLGWRDVHEIMMRSAAVVDPMYGEWSYNPMGMPMSHKYGAGLVDALRAVQMAKVWKNLGPRFGAVGALQGTYDYREVKGDFRVLAANRVIPDNSFTNPNKQDVSLSVPGPSPNLRVEHVVVRLKVRHGRRGDLGIMLIAPGSGQADAPMESYLYVPHRDDFNSHIGLPDEPDSGGDRGVVEGEYFDFMTVRHWGTSGQNPVLNPASSSAGGDWTLKIWDNTSQGVTATANPNATNPQDRIQVPIANPVSTGPNAVIGRVEYASVSFHGTTSPSDNEAPLILDDVYLGRTAQPFQARVRTITDLTGLPDGVSQRAPILPFGYRVRVLGPISAGAPELIIDSFGPGVGAHLAFDRNTGIFTNGSLPLPKHSWSLQLFASNVFGTTRRNVSLIIQDTLTYAQWKTLYGITSDRADPDFDGVPNMLEYGMGGQPLVYEPFLLPVTTIVGSNLVYDYRVDSGIIAQVVRPQVSSALNPLGSWTDLVPVEVARAGVLRFMQVTVPIIDGTKQFVRLKIGTP